MTDTVTKICCLIYCYSSKGAESLGTALKRAKRMIRVKKTTQD